MSSGLFHNVLVASDNSACELNYGIIPARLRAVSFVALLCRGSVYISSFPFLVPFVLFVVSLVCFFGFRFSSFKLENAIFILFACSL